MSLLAPWLAFPLVLAALSLGCGLLLERVSGLRLPGALVLPAGLAVLSLVAQFAVMTSATARLAVPAVVAVSVAGYGLSLPGLRSRRRLDGWAAVAALGAYAAYAAPIVLSGRATWAGYIKLDDNSTLLALTDRAMEHGRSIAGVEPSTYFRVLDGLLVHGYPLATFMPLGVGHTLLGTDGTWLYQPCMAFMAAMLALSLYELVRKLVDRAWFRAFAAFVAAQSALLYGYALWGGIKEIGTAWALPLLVALVPVTVRSDRLRSLIPLAAASALLLGVLNVGAAVWLAPALLFTLVAIYRREGVKRALHATGAFAGFLLVLALPTVVAAPDFLGSNIVTYSALTSLIKPLSPLQMAGIWPTGDFRFDPARIGITDVLAAVALFAAAAAVIWAVRRGDWPLPLFVVGALASALVLWAASTPWITGKAFATASPAVPLAALVAAALLLRGGRVVEGAVLATVIAGGVLWSNVLQYHDAWLAPASQLTELEHVGSRFAGDSPALMTEYQPYGVRHYLRSLAAEGASELRVRPVPLRDGSLLSQGAYANIDDFSLDAVLVYRTLVLRRSPLESRPPSSYRLVSRGRWYDVWQRPEAGGRHILEHLSLGNDLDPAGVPRCSEVERLARLAGPGGELAAVGHRDALVVDLSTAAVPSGWSADSSGGIVPSGAGAVQAVVQVRRPGRYGLWLAGSFRDRMEVAVDGRPVDTARGQLNWSGVYTPLGQVQLASGGHVVTLRYEGPDWRPGSGGPQFGFGPLVLGRVAADPPVQYVSSADARSLCGRRLDWIEALGA